MPQYQSLPAIPNEKIPQWMYDLLTAVKEDLEIIMGTRGPGRAVTNDSVTVKPQQWQTMTQISAQGDYVNSAAGLAANGCPTIADHIKLMNDVQNLATDVAKLVDGFNTLIAQIRE